MKRIKSKLIIILLFSLTAFAGCQNETMDIAQHISQTISVNISANALAMPEIDKNTRAAILDENTILESQIILFDENDLYTGVYPVINRQVAIPHSSAKRSLYVIANANAIIAEKSTFWKYGETPSSEIISSLVQSNKTGKMPDMPFVMHAKLEFPDGINSNSAISDNGTNSGSPLLLKRNVAKVSIGIDTSMEESFIIERIMLCNVPKNGYLTTDEPVTSEFDNYDLMPSGTNMYSFASSPDASIIIEARSKTNGTFEAKPRYYKLSVKNPQTGQPYGLKQNNWYKITIVSKSGNGYYTLEDAINGAVMNQITTTIEVRDITMHDYIFGRDCYIGTSNTHYEQYGHKANGTAYEVCKVKFANAIDNGDILGNTSVRVINGDITLTQKSIDVISAAKNNETYSVEVYFNKNETEGTLCLRYKDLVKYIHVKAAVQPDPNTDQFIEIPLAVSGNIETPNTTWAGINNQKIITTDQSMDLSSSTGGTLYLTIAKNQALFTPRELTALFARAQTGMTRVSIIQSR